MVGALVSHIAVGIGLDTGFVVLSSIAVMTFVTSVLNFVIRVIQFAQVHFRSFAIGLGPVPFVLISEVSPPHVSVRLASTLTCDLYMLHFQATSALSSFGLSMNCNIVIESPDLLMADNVFALRDGEFCCRSHFSAT